VLSHPLREEANKVLNT
jgi:DnaJ-class molecular chaperone